MRRLVFAIPGDIATPTGGYVYDRRVMALLPGHGVEVTHLPLPGGFPFPTEAELRETAALVGRVPSDAALLIDGLAFGAIPEGCLASIAAPIVVVLHHPLGLETGLSDPESLRLLVSEKAALKFARQIIVTSRTTAETLQTLGFAPPPPVTVAMPGTDPAARAAGGSGICQIISVGAVVPRKGHDLLIEALARLTDREWTCAIAGSLDRDNAFAARLIQRISEANLQDRISLPGALSFSALDALYAQADIFALPSRYEGYGMVFSEALARGLPIVAARAGAVPDTVPSEAGILVPADDVEALTEALALLITDRDHRRMLSDAAWAHAQHLPRWEDTARIIAGVVRKVS